MDLKTTIIKMKENEKTFYPLLESMKRKADKGLLGDITSKDIEDTVNLLENENLNKEKTTQNISVIQELFELDEAIRAYENIESAPEVLDEAVTYIDNAGNLKTKSAVDYVKDMHEYHTETQIQKYKKKKNRDYKLISEEIDIDNIKMLSEMSLEEILAEEL